MLQYPAKWNEGDCLSISFLDLEIVTQGKTQEELLEMAEDALSETIAYLYDTNRDVPEPSQAKGKNVVYVKVLPHIAIPVLLRNARKNLGLSQKEIAGKMKVPYTSYQRWEKIDGFNPTLRKLEKAAKALGKKLIVDLI
jgi:predicted RNase H-like HicB family nuclease